MHARGPGGREDGAHQVTVNTVMRGRVVRVGGVGWGGGVGEHLRLLLAGTQTAKLSVKSSIMALGFPCQCRAAH